MSCCGRGKPVTPAIRVNSSELDGKAPSGKRMKEFAPQVQRFIESCSIKGFVTQPGGAISLALASGHKKATLEVQVTTSGVVPTAPLVLYAAGVLVFDFADTSQELTVQQLGIILKLIAS